MFMHMRVLYVSSRCIWAACPPYMSYVACVCIEAKHNAIYDPFHTSYILIQ